MSSIAPTELTDAHWQALHELAVEAMTHAYAPYSRFKVGAAALVDDGRLVSGCNVENAGYGVTLCAECGLVSELTRTGGGRLVAFACVDAHGRRCGGDGHGVSPPSVAAGQPALSSAGRRRVRRRRR